MRSVASHPVDGEVHDGPGPTGATGARSDRAGALAAGRGEVLAEPLEVALVEFEVLVAHPFAPSVTDDGRTLDHGGFARPGRSVLGEVERCVVGVGDAEQEHLRVEVVCPDR